MNKKINSSKKRNPSRETAKWIAQAASDVHAIDLKVLDLRELTALTDYFVIASGRSDRQVQAICQRIEETMKHRHRHPIGIEGYTKGHWILIDYGEVVAHVFYEEVRNFYALEKLWSDAPVARFKLK